MPVYGGGSICVVMCMSDCMCMCVLFVSACTEVLEGAAALSTLDQVVDFRCCRPLKEAGLLGEGSAPGQRSEDQGLEDHMPTSSLDTCMTSGTSAQITGVCV